MPDPDLLSAHVDPQVQPSVALPMNAIPEAFGAGVGQVVENIGEELSRRHEIAVQQANHTAHVAANNEDDAFVEAKLYNPKTGILNQPLGKDAIAGADQVLADYDAHSAKVADSLANEQQKQSYARSRTNRRFQIQRQLDAYAHAETSRYADETDHAALTNTANQAVQQANNVEALDGIFQYQAAIIQDAGQRKGLDKTVVAEQITDAASQTHLDVLRQLSATGQDISANHWYEAHKSELTARDAITAAQIVQAGSLAGESQRIADTIVYDKSGAVETREALMAKIRDDKRLQENPKLRDEVDTRINKFLAETRQAEVEKNNATFENAFTIASESAQGLYDPRVVTAMATLPSAQQDQLKARFTRDTAPNMANPTVAQEYYDLQRMVGTEAFIHVDLMKSRAVLPTAEWKSLVDAQAEQIQKGPKSPKVIEVTTSNDIISRYKKQLNIDTTTDAGAGQFLDFQRKFDLAVAQERLTNGGKEPGTDAKIAIAKSLAGDFVTEKSQHWFTWDSTAPLYTQPDEVALATVAQSMDAERFPAGFTRANLENWKRGLADKTAPNYQAGVEQLKRWKQGISSDGSYDPSLKERYRIIREELGRDATAR